MKKLFFATAVVTLTLLSSSCKKETTCECQTYEVQDDGSEVKQGDPTTRVVDSKDADCSQFNDYTDNPIGNDTKVECSEKVFD